MEVARAGEMSAPPLPAPTGLLPFLQFARLPPAALGAARRVLDADAEFRERVAAATSESAVGREGWLFLTRPDGWEAELDHAARTRTDVESAAADARAEQDARRRLPRLEATVARLESELAEARRELAQAAGALTEERRVSAEASRRAAELADRLTAARDERERRRSDAQAAAAEVARLRAELAARAPVVDIAAVATAVAAASAAADRLQRQLATATAALQAIDAPQAAVDPLIDADGRASLPPASASPATRRKPAALPPAVFDDSDEAAVFLVRVNGMVLLVDGYNVSMLGWPGQPITEQRTRLVDALAELVARTGVEVEVVFDGAADTSAPAVGARRGVRVSFSPPGVEADDVVIARAVEVPAHRPVTVASNDRRVREGAHAAGANVVSSPQLLAALRR
jgi:predicted RNA-binding protein with PIN domain